MNGSSTTLRGAQQHESLDKHLAIHRHRKRPERPSSAGLRGQTMASCASIGMIVGMQEVSRGAGLRIRAPALPEAEEGAVSPRGTSPFPFTAGSPLSAVGSFEAAMAGGQPLTSPLRTKGPLRTKRSPTHSTPKKGRRMLSPVIFPSPISVAQQTRRQGATPFDDDSSGESVASSVPSRIRYVYHPPPVCQPKSHDDTDDIMEWSVKLAQLKILWRDLLVPRKIRDDFSSLVTSRITARNRELLDRELSRLTNLRNALHHLEQCAEQREKAVADLLKLSKQRKELPESLFAEWIRSTVASYQTATLRFVLGCRQVRNDLANPEAPFRWRGHDNYLLKIQEDASVLDNNVLRDVLGYPLDGNPMLRDPSAPVTKEMAAAEEYLNMDNKEQLAMHTRHRMQRTADELRSKVVAIQRVIRGFLGRCRARAQRFRARNVSSMLSQKCPASPTALSPRNTSRSSSMLLASISETPSLPVNSLRPSLYSLLRKKRDLHRAVRIHKRFIRHPHVARAGWYPPRYRRQHILCETQPVPRRVRAAHALRAAYLMYHIVTGPTPMRWFQGVNDTKAPPRVPILWKRLSAISGVHSTLQQATHYELALLRDALRIVMHKPRLPWPPTSSEARGVRQSRRSRCESDCLPFGESASRASMKYIPPIPSYDSFLGINKGLPWDEARREEFVFLPPPFRYGPNARLAALVSSLAIVLASTSATRGRKSRFTAISLTSHRRLQQRVPSTTLAPDMVSCSTPITTPRGIRRASLEDEGMVTPTTPGETPIGDLRMPGNQSNRPVITRLNFSLSETVDPEKPLQTKPSFRRPSHRNSAFTLKEVETDVTTDTTTPYSFSLPFLLRHGMVVRRWLHERPSYNNLFRKHRPIVGALHPQRGHIVKPNRVAPPKICTMPLGLCTRKHIVATILFEYRPTLSVVNQERCAEKVQSMYKMRKTMQQVKPLRQREEERDRQYKVQQALEERIDAVLTIQRWWQRQMQIADIHFLWETNAMMIQQWWKGILDKGGGLRKPKEGELRLSIRAVDGTVREHPTSPGSVAEESYVVSADRLPQGLRNNIKRRSMCANIGRRISKVKVGSQTISLRKFWNLVMPRIGSYKGLQLVHVAGRLDATLAISNGKLGLALLTIAAPQIGPGHSQLLLAS
eukprot:Sspe_Gene.98348::Locus_71769_Transcript_1_1_Confidence_1.000_Length_3573::g.98348::m.98348